MLNSAVYEAWSNPVLQHKRRWIWKKKSMSDNIRNKAIFEIKTAKIAQNVPTIDILQIWLWRCTMGMFLLTLQKIPVSLPVTVTEIWPGQKHKFKKWFFGQNFQNFCQNWILIFRSTTSVGVLFWDFFARKVLGDMARTRKALQTNGRTGHTRREKQYMSPAGGDI